ncbi:MAG TPA: DUF1847 domain-containing protein [Bacillota bacterium]|jgi:uncharacterized metal-binding protein
MSESPKKARCAVCTVHVCREEAPEKIPGNCPSVQSPEVMRAARAAYDDQTMGRIARAAALTESAGYMKWTRVEEIMEFSKRMGYARLGIAFCIGLSDEARALHKVFEDNGFEAVSVICKTGGRPKEDLGLADADKVRPGGFEAMCNPAAQAMLLNAEETELNVLVGLCVGHDSTFIKFSEAPVTVAVVKDRVLAHNPAAVLNCRYYRQRLKEHHR